MSLFLVQARIFAQTAHIHQKYGTEPYVVHLDRVVELLKETGERSETLLCAGYLHDSLEDTRIGAKDIEKHFGTRARELVELVTDPPGKNRQERKAKLYPRLVDQPEAMAIKLADRCANVENCLKDYFLGDPRSKLGMYLAEQEDFEKLLRVGMNYTYNKDLWKHLNWLFDISVP